MIHQIYNDITIEVPLYADGDELSTEDKDITVYVVCNRFKKEMHIIPYDNIVSFTFYGKDQVVRGNYDVEVWIDKGQEYQMYIPFKNAFCLR